MTHGRNLHFRGVRRGARCEVRGTVVGDVLHTEVVVDGGWLVDVSGVGARPRQLLNTVDLK